MANYRTKLRNLGCPELTVNNLKQKHPDETLPARNVKKPKDRGELFTTLPGETKETLEKETEELIEETKKRNNSKIISEKMAKTFSLRRQEVVLQCPSFADMKVQEEFLRITTLRLEPKCMSLLDKYTPRLLSIFNSKGGTAGGKLQTIIEHLHQGTSTIEKRREVMIQCLIEYLGEDGLIKDYLDVDGVDARQDFSQHILKIFVINKEGALAGDSPEDIGIIIEGEEVMSSISNMPMACCTLIYICLKFNVVKLGGSKLSVL
ncbi:uncharacterized protein LOC136749911 [Amia ocellicauda]|uniref:uncharacterized protein LOC136749911 n=1 Tax=Amia ocellicauda TaxID=2972642 RepID=UPI00346444D5